MINEQIKKQVTAERLEIFLTKLNISYSYYMAATFPNNPLETIAAKLGPKYARKKSRRCGPGSDCLNILQPRLSKVT